MIYTTDAIQGSRPLIWISIKTKSKRVGVLLLMV